MNVGEGKDLKWPLLSIRERLLRKRGWEWLRSRKFESGWPGRIKSERVSERQNTGWIFRIFVASPIKKNIVFPCKMHTFPGGPKRALY